MDWVKEFYTRKSEWFSPTGVLEHHHARAANSERLCGPGVKRTLELGAGAGGTATAMADLGHTVVAVEQSPLRSAYAKDLAKTPRKRSKSQVSLWIQLQMSVLCVNRYGRQRVT
jgi:protein-L-isoaspartate O-methyltransferase